MNRIFMLIGCLFLGVVQSADFFGYYDVSNWASTPSPGSIDTASAPTSITMVSGNTGIGSVTPSFCRVMPDAGTVSFCWSFTTADDSAFYDPFAITIAGVRTEIFGGSPRSGSGCNSFPVSAGDSFCFRAETTDGVAGSSTTVISSFSGPCPPCTGKICGADDGCGGKCFIPCASAAKFIPVPTSPISFQSSTTFIFTVQVSIVGSAVGTPTGTVTVVEVTKNTLMCQAILTPTTTIGIAQGSCPILIPQGNWAFNAIYSGDSVFGTSSAQVLPALQSITFQVPGGSTATINNVNTQINQDINPGDNTFRI